MTIEVSLDNPTAEAYAIIPRDGESALAAPLYPPRSEGDWGFIAPTTDGGEYVARWFRNKPSSPTWCNAKSASAEINYYTFPINPKISSRPRTVQTLLATAPPPQFYLNIKSPLRLRTNFQSLAYIRSFYENIRHGGDNSLQLSKPRVFEWEYPQQTINGFRLLPDGNGLPSVWKYEVNGDAPVRTQISRMSPDALGIPGTYKAYSQSNLIFRFQGGAGRETEILSTQYERNSAGRVINGSAVVQTRYTGVLSLVFACSSSSDFIFGDYNLYSKKIEVVTNVTEYTCYYGSWSVTGGTHSVELEEDTWLFDEIGSPSISVTKYHPDDMEAYGLTGGVSIP